MSDQNQIEALIQGYQRRDPRLYDILRLLAGSVTSLRTLINEVITPEVFVSEDPTLPLPAGMSYSLPGDSVKIEWSDIDIYGNLLNAVTTFEVRKGSVWASAVLVTRTTSYRINVVPDLPAGDHQYLLKTINSSGQYSTSAISVTVSISPVSPVTLTAQVIDNNVLLYWDEPTTHSFNIAKYELFREGVSLGIHSGTFASFFENVGGTFEYGIIAYDLADNTSPPTTIEALVSAPPDFELIGSYTSTFTGTKTKCIAEAGMLLAPVFTSETFDDHFINNSFDQISDFIAAGYGPWITPSESTAEYKEVFDFGLIISGALVNVAWAAQQFDGSIVAVSCAIEASDDGITYSAPISGVSAYFTSCRYARVTLTFTPASDKSLVAITNLTCSIDIKYTVDSGEVTADKDDVSGTPVLFNKSFKDINSITLTVFSIEPVTAVYDFTDVPNPTGFYVYALDSAGVRITYPVSWKARGII